MSEYSQTFLAMNEDITGRQKEIIEAALEIISEGGIQALTIKNLSQRVGFAESAVYRHYRSKSEILIAILDLFSKKTDYFFNHEMNEKDDAIEKIENFFENNFRTFAESPSLVVAIFSEEMFRNEVELSKMVRKIMESNISRMSKLVEEGQTKGIIRTDIDADHFAVIIMGALRIFVKIWHLEGRRYALADEGQTFISSIGKLLQSESKTIC